MTEYNGNITNILQGVSQQARIDRRQEQLEEQVNCISSITNGISNRPGSNQVAHYSQDDYTAETMYHTYDRGDNQERYAIYFPRNKEVYVRDLFTGSLVPLATNSNEGYLECSNPKTAIRCYTIADTTFVLNREKVPVMNNESGPEPVMEAMIYCARASWGMVYTVYYGDDIIAQAESDATITLDLSSSSASENNKAVNLQTSDLIDCLCTGVSVDNFTWVTGYTGGLSAWATANSITLEYKDSAIYILGPSSGIPALSATSESVNITNSANSSSVVTDVYTLADDDIFKVTATVTGQAYHSALITLVQPLKSVVWEVYCCARFKYYTAGEWKYGEWSTQKAVSIDTSNIFDIVTPISETPIERICVELKIFDQNDDSHQQLDPVPRDYTYVEIGNISVYSYSSPTAGVKLTVSDDTNGVDLRIIGNKFNKYSDLPRVAWHGFKVKITGEDDKKDNDYYVEFIGDYETEGFQQGTWTECIGFSLNQTIDPTTMPHLLTRQPDGTFSLDQVEWLDRIAGDEDSNPEPSFINGSITEIINYQGRLVLLSEENAVGSCTFEHFNFFAPSVLTSADSDPIDTAVSDNQVSNLYNAVIFHSNLVLFSDRAQFVHPSEQLFTSKNFSLQSTMQYKNNEGCKPVVSASSIFFAYNYGEFAGIREISISAVSGAIQADDITKHVDHYMAGAPIQLAASSDYDTLFVRTDKSPNGLYVYQWYNADGERKQAAWHYWDFGYEVVNMSLLQDTLYIWILRGDNVFIEEINMSNTDTVGAAFNIRLDSKIFQDGVDNETEYWDVDVSDLTANAGFTYDDIVVTCGENTGIGGRRPSWIPHPTTADTIQVLKESVFPDEGETPTFIIGVPFEAYGELTNPYVRDQLGVPKTKGRLRLGSMSFNVSNTGDLTIEVTKKNSPTYTKTFTSALIDNSEFLLDNPRPMLDTKIPVAIRSDADRCTIRFKSSMHTPFNITSIDWSGSYYETGSRTR